MTIRTLFETTEITISIPGYSAKNYLFEIDGTRYHATPLSFSPNRVDFTIGHHNYFAWISEDSDNMAYVSVGGHIFNAKRHDILAESVVASGFDKHGHDSDHVTSPMPGKVIRVHVKPGDNVKKGDTLLIIEAMKMENQVVSPRDATVKEVYVATNERVESSTVLVDFVV